MIEMGKKYQTRDGRAVRILCVDVKGKMRSVLGLITYGDGTEGDCRWTANGYYYPADQGQHLQNSDLDLVPVPTKHEGWCVVYADGDYRTAVKNHFLFSTEEFARGWADIEKLFHDTASVAHVTWED